MGVKYCGGCNNQYDRTSFLEEIKASFPHVEFSYVKEDEVYDVVLFLQGCERACADRNYRARKGFFDVTSATLKRALEDIKEVLCEQ